MSPTGRLGARLEPTGHHEHRRRLRRRRVPACRRRARQAGDL